MKLSLKILSGMANSVDPDQTAYAILSATLVLEFKEIHRMFSWKNKTRIPLKLTLYLYWTKSLRAQNLGQGHRVRVHA